MATLVVNVDDALLERISDVAQVRGEATEQVIVEALYQVFPAQMPEEGMPLDIRIAEILAPFWAEQDRHEADGKISDPIGQPGDVIEEYLAQHWAEDIRTR